MPTYDPLRSVSHFGAITAHGTMDGEFFTAKFRNPAVTLYEGSGGRTALVPNQIRSGEVTWVLSQSSPTNRELSLAFAAGTIAHLTIEDLDDGSLVSGDAQIENHADIKRGGRVVGMEWKFLVPSMTIQYRPPRSNR